MIDGTPNDNSAFRTAMQRIERVLSRVSTAALWIAGAGLVLMTAIVAWQVYGRYVLNRSPAWSEASSILTMRWFIFLGAAVGVRERTHLGFDVLVYFLPASAKAILRTISDIAVLGFGIGMAIYGWQLAAGTWDTTLPTLPFPGGAVFVPVIAGGALIVLFCLERIARRLAGLRPDDDEARLEA